MEEKDYVEFVQGYIKSFPVQNKNPDFSKVKKAAEELFKTTLRDIICVKDDEYHGKQDCEFKLVNAVMKALYGYSYKDLVIKSLQYEIERNDSQYGTTSGEIDWKKFGIDDEH